MLDQTRPPWAIHKSEFLSEGHPFLNRAFLYGESIFTTLAMRAGRFFALAENLARLEAHALYLYGQNLGALKAEILSNLKFIRQSIGVDVLVRITLFSPAPQLAPRAAPLPLRCLCFCASLPHSFPPTVQVALAQEMNICFSPLKGANLLERLRLVRLKNSEVLFYNQQNFLTEASTANIFLFINGQVRTPAVGPGVFDGILRAHFLSFLNQFGHPVLQGPVSLAELSQASALVLSNQVQLLLPVCRLENGWQEDDNGREWREQLMPEFKRYYNDYAQEL